MFSFTAIIRISDHFSTAVVLGHYLYRDSLGYSGTPDIFNLLVTVVPVWYIDNPTPEAGHNSMRITCEALVQPKACSSHVAISYTNLS